MIEVTQNLRYTDLRADEALPDYNFLLRWFAVLLAGIKNFNSHTSCWNRNWTSGVYHMVMSPADRERNWKARENALLGQIDFMFQWHADAYYELSASGVVYDAINLGIPLLARYGAEIKYLQDAGTPIALVAESVDDLVELFSRKYVAGELISDHALFQENLLKIRTYLTEDALAKQFKKIIPLI